MSSLQGLGLVAFAIIAGALISLQAPINTMAGQRLGHPLAGATVSFIAGTVFLIVLTALFAGKHVNASAVWSMPPLLFMGGILGAFYVWLSIWLTPKIGIGAVIALGIAGQVLASLALDHYGWLNLAVREITPGRLSGAVMVVVGSLMVRYL